ncbi:MAG TPA: hypothetical protein PLQ11_02065 [Beijerinckiaceae bacterium]|nr:hypothetical protein [Beijerinckiaceae bacterium]
MVDATRFQTLKRIAIFAGLGFGIAACATPANQQARVQAYANANAATAPGQPDDSLETSSINQAKLTHYVEFRSRYAHSYGHTFLVHGRLNGKRIATGEVAGLHPRGDDPSVWVLGHFIPVASETGASDGDTEDQYISARYRIYLTAAQYDKVSAKIRQLQASSPMWHAVWYNCNAFVADVAGFMGLQSPNSLELPADFINGMRRLNNSANTIIPAALTIDR